MEITELIFRDVLVHMKDALTRSTNILNDFVKLISRHHSIIVKAPTKKISRTLIMHYHRIRCIAVNIKACVDQTRLSSNSAEIALGVEKCVISAAIAEGISFRMYKSFHHLKRSLDLPA